jgi:hypothetical protein
MLNKSLIYIKKVKKILAKKDINDICLQTIKNIAIDKVQELLTDDSINYEYQEGPKDNELLETKAIASVLNSFNISYDDYEKYSDYSKFIPLDVATEIIDGDAYELQSEIFSNKLINTYNILIEEKTRRQLTKK